MAAFTTRDSTMRGGDVLRGISAAPASYISSVFQIHRRVAWRQYRGTRSNPPFIGGPIAFEQRPQIIQAKKRRLYRLSCGRVLQFPFVVVTPVTALAPTFISTRRHRFGKRFGHYLTIPLVQNVVPSDITARRQRPWSLRRERLQDTSWITVVTPPVTIWTPLTIRPKILRYAFVRRTKLLNIPRVGGPPAFVWTPTNIVERRVRTYLTRRRKLNDFVPAPTADISAWTPQNIRIRTKPFFVRRGKQTLTVQQQTLLASSFVRRTRLFGLKRPRRIDPYMPQAIAPTPPAFNPTFLSRRQRQGFAKRGKRFDRPWVGGPVAFLWSIPQIPRRLRTMGMLLRKGRRTDVIPAQVIPAVSVWTPQPTGKRARFVLTRKRGRQIDHLAGQHFPMAQIVARKTGLSVKGRTRAWQPMLTQAMPVQVISRLPRRTYQISRPMLRRMVFTAAQLAPIQVVSGTRKRIARIRRSKRFDFTIVISLPPPPSVWRAGIVRSRWAKGFNRRRQHFGSFLVHNISRIFPTITTGETDRPEGGETDRAQSGETDSPSRGDVL